MRTTLEALETIHTQKISIKKGLPANKIKKIPCHPSNASIVGSIHISLS